MNRYLWLVLTIPALLFFRVNLSSSMPYGLYIKRPFAKLKYGQYISVCLPKKIAKEGRKKFYLMPGFCEGLAMPVLKVLIAVPGDNVSITATEMIVNGQAYQAPQLIIGIALSNQQPTQLYWLYGQHAPIHSWDSRYFGGVEERQIIGVYEPVWTGKGDDSVGD